jgi:hypothetical protein
VIVVKNDDGNLEIVDGQQRLTTVYLLLVALKHVLQTRTTWTERPAQTKYFQVIRSLVSDDDTLRLRSPYQDGTMVLEALVNSGRKHQLSRIDLNQPQRNLLDVYEVVDEWVLENLDDVDSILSFTDVLLSRVYFTRLKIQDIPLALDYFEKMNRRGLPLAASDLLKNFMFAQVSDADYEALTDSWSKMQKELDNVQRNALKSTEGFIRSWAISESGTKINGTEPLLEFWKKKLSSQQKILAFRDELGKTSVFYRKVANGQHLKTKDKVILEGANFFNGVQHLSVLFAGRHLKEFDYLCDLVERRFLIYTFSRERTASFESMIPSWCRELSGLGENSSQAEILRASRRASGFVVSDASEAIAVFLDSLTYLKGSHHKKIRFVLASVSRHIDQSAKAGDHDKDLSAYWKTVRKRSAGVDLDHVLGQKYFKDVSPEDRTVFNSIGALTPLFSSDHREQTQLLPHEKAAMYRNSRYVLTQSLAVVGEAPPRVRRVIADIQSSVPASLDNWTTDSVKKRGHFISNTFVEVLGVAELMSKP